MSNKEAESQITDDTHGHAITCARWVPYDENHTRYDPDRSCTCKSQNMPPAQDADSHCAHCDKDFVSVGVAGASLCAPCFMAGHRGFVCRTSSCVVTKKSLSASRKWAEDYAANPNANPRYQRTVAHVAPAQDVCPKCGGERFRSEPTCTYISVPSTGVICGYVFPAPALVDEATETVTIPFDKACPFCNVVPDPQPHGGAMVIHENDCYFVLLGVIFRLQMMDKKQVERWNTRTPDPALTELVRAARKCVDVELDLPALRKALEPYKEQSDE